MIDLSFDPALVVGPLRTTWHALLLTVGVLVGTTTGVLLGARRVTVDDAWLVALAGAAGGLLGGRLFHVIDYWSEYARDPARIFQLQQGASVIGGLIVGSAAGVAVAFLRRPREWRYLVDCAAVGIPFGMGVGRIGDLINGEHWSIACSGLPWCVRYTHPNTAGQREFVHPAVGYELVGDLVIGLIAIRLFARGGAGEGRIFAVWLALYGAMRFAVNFLRIDAPISGLGLTQAQWLALGFVAAGLLVLLRRPAAAR